MFKLEWFTTGGGGRFAGFYDTPTLARKAAAQQVASLDQGRDKYKLAHWDLMGSVDEPVCIWQASVLKRVGGKNPRGNVTTNWSIYGCLRVSKVDDLEYLARAGNTEGAKTRKAKKVGVKKNPSAYKLTWVPNSKENISFLGYFDSVETARMAAYRSSKNIGPWRTPQSWDKDESCTHAAVYGEKGKDDPDINNLLGWYDIDRVNDLEYLAMISKHGT